MISQRKIEAYLEARKERDALAEAFDEEVGPDQEEWRHHDPQRWSALQQARAAVKATYAKLTGQEIGAMRRQQAELDAARRQMDQRESLGQAHTPSTAGI